MTKATYFTRVETLLSRWDDEIEAARGSMSRLEAQLRENVEETAADLKVKAAGLKQELEKWKEAREEDWGTVRVQLDDLSRDLVSAGQRFVEKVDAVTPSDDSAQRTKYFFSPSPNGGWDLKKKGVKRSTKHFASKAEGLAYSRRYVRLQEPSQLVVRRQDGTIQRAHCYGRKADTAG